MVEISPVLRLKPRALIFAKNGRLRSKMRKKIKFRDIFGAQANYSLKLVFRCMNAIFIQ